MLEGPDWVATSTVTFRCHEPGASTFVDCDAEVQHATLNGLDLDLATVAAGTTPAARPGRAQRAGRLVGPARHRPGRRDPAQRRPVGQARLRLELLRARRRASRLGVLRPARPQGATPVHGERPGRLDRHQQHGPRLGRPTGTTTAGSGPSRTRRACRRTSSWSTPGPSTRSASSAASTASGSTAGSPCAGFLERDATELLAADRAGARVLRRAVRLAVPAGALRPGVRAGPRWRHGELGLRHLERQRSLPEPPDPRRSASSSPPCCCTRWRTCGSATW